MNILFVLAHPDDEAYGPGGTIAKLAQNHKVTVAVLCNGARPGSIHVLKARQQAFDKSCKILGVDDAFFGTHDDCSLTLPVAISEMERIVSAVKPSAVYTHNTADLHQDHRIVAEAALVACRPKLGSSVKALYMSENIGTDWGFGVVGNSFVPDTFVDVSDTMIMKTKALELYTSEVYEFPDARSIESVKALSRKRGSTVGVRHAEAFQQVFRLA